MGKGRGFLMEETLLLIRSSAIKGQAPPSFDTFVGLKCKFRHCSVMAHC